ncbi:MAG: hypothetical protein V4702_05160 [Patescibacteria group bacterium]
MVVTNFTPEIPGALPSGDHELPSQPEGPSGFRRFAAIGALIALGGGAVGFGVGQATSSDHAPAPVTANPYPEKSAQEEVQTPELYEPFDFESAYAESKAVLEHTGLKLAVAVTLEEERRLGDIRQKISDAEQAGIIYGEKGGGKEGDGFRSNEDYYKEFKGVLTKEEVDLYFQKNHLAYDRSMRERDDVEVALANNSASYFGSVRTTSGIRFNIFEANSQSEPPMSGEAVKLMVDPKALDVATEYLLYNLNSLGEGNQLILSQAEIKQIKSNAKQGKITMNIIMADEIGDCVINTSVNTDTYQLRHPVPSEVCYGGATESDQSKIQNTTSSDYRNILILIGRSNYPITSLFNTYQSHNMPISSVDIRNETLMVMATHEIAHGLVGASTLTYRQRFGDSPSFDGNDPEHRLIVKELEQRVANFFVFQTPQADKLAAFTYRKVSPGPMKAE